MASMAMLNCPRWFLIVKTCWPDKYDNIATVHFARNRSLCLGMIKCCPEVNKHIYIYIYICIYRYTICFLETSKHDIFFLLHGWWITNEVSYGYRIESAIVHSLDGTRTPNRPRPCAFHIWGTCFWVLQSCAADDSVELLMNLSGN